ncbi:MAG: carboxymuconolactone decarboxylase family protein [Veillonella sp.]|uniref:carboxymuconolactone decarboxylase family protein n=1 Tax=Veillonella sp. TaxID=1926307 RepID=UPI001D31A1B6|nr:carboxymuconolactone decarboxylase family protein [Veillonella sp.]MBS7015207.1 carboxymuconolactone decarboxylase family protein [Veillonella sp.]
MKKVLTLTLAVAIVAGGYMSEANGAGEQPSKQAPSISEINIYTPKELNARQKDLVDIGRYTASGDQGALKSTIASAIERGTLTPQEVSIAIRQLYSAAGLKQMNEALSTFNQLREERPEFGADYEKMVPKQTGLSALLGNGTNGAALAKAKNEDAKEAVQYNTFRMKKPKPQNRNRSRLGKLDRELVAAAALGTRVGKNNLFAASEKSLSELGLSKYQIENLETLIF